MSCNLCRIQDNGQPRPQVHAESVMGDEEDGVGWQEADKGLARVDSDQRQLENPDAIRRCPTGAIVWVEERQFAAASSAERSVVS